MSNGREHTVPTDILDDLCSRFIINVPEEEKSQTNRIMFQPCGIKQFALHLFHHLPLLRPHLADFEAVLARWREYKLAVPTCGAILLDETCQHVLLVQGFYSRASLHRCAVREVQEEIGYDISEALSRDDYLEQVVNEQRVRLYLIPGVSRATKFQPRTRNEIKSIEWFAVADLPNRSEGRAVQGQARAQSKQLLHGDSVCAGAEAVDPAAAGGRGRRVAVRRGRERPPDEARGRQQQAGSQVLQDEPTELASRGGSRGRSGGAKAAATPQRPAQPASRGSRSRTKSQSNSSLAEDRSAIGDEFSAPSWENFSFDRKKILDALAG
ncbi:m7GpppN-mRNA hydrolase [Amphibalanus amphitrite]|nr:m7GpppN-mRNA hydrolase [Amphibalanus amphitrite]